MREAKIELALLDVNVSGEKTGIDLGNYIREYFPETKIIFLTSYSDSETIAKISAIFPQGYLSKPVNKVDLSMAVKLTLQQDLQKDLPFEFSVGKLTYSIVPSQLLYAQSEHVYVKLIFVEEELLLRISLTALLELFPKKVLKRVNRSVAINESHTKRKTSKIVEVNGERFKISSTYSANWE